MRRRGRGGGVRARYLTELEHLAKMCGAEFGDPFGPQLALVKAGAPVLVPHGYEIDLPPDSGPFCLEPDGTITAVEPVYRDPDAPLRTVIGHRRPDGTLVDEQR